MLETVHPLHVPRVGSPATAQQEIKTSRRIKYMIIPRCTNNNISDLNAYKGMKASPHLPPIYPVLVMQYDASSTAIMKTPTNIPLPCIGRSVRL